MEDLLPGVLPTKPSSRRLDASEAYYLLLERRWAVNPLCAVEIAADAATVSAAWAATVERLPVLGARLRTVDGRAEVVFGGRGAAEVWKTFPTVEEAMAAQASTPFDAEQPIGRCALVEGDGVTTAVMAAHHSQVDGRAFAQIALVLGAFAAGEEPAEQPLMRMTVSVESLTANEVDGRRRRRQLLALAREVRGEEAYVDHADRLSWHDPAVDKPRDLACALFRLDADSTAGLLKQARAIGATVYGLVVAAVLGSCAELSPDAERLALATPVDLRVVKGTPGDAPVGQAATLILGSYDVTKSDDDLARAVSAGVHRRIGRGEAELLFALSGAERMPVGPESDDAVRHWIADSTPAVCVSNVGIIAEPVPASIRGITIGHAPTPNQSLFFVVTTVGGRINAILTYDRNRVSIDGDKLALMIRERLEALSETA
ncbi:phthiocerol/phthiodiolone dimycocerosyl transferase family protein [Smaragdicoccus niigatensis]|uniref:phthiocerol/phthiodiolone dimycocerosyl transferase family protein n=1 Tax=Smaragdicoccus niigatensis TaxID=359359 RepID=UPI00035F3AC7|nr:hypothetical protein [Smaragdicoccus niigatensis]